MSNAKRHLRIKDKIYDLRIYSKNIAPVQEMLDNKSFESAAIDAHEEPVKNTIPFLWGILQKKEEPVSDSQAYDLYDDLVDEGYNAEDFSKLIIDICMASGFFAPARVEVLLAIFKRMKETQRAVISKVNEKPEEIERQEENPN